MSTVSYSSPQFMAVGEHVEFCSDRQTDRGPSTGSIVIKEGTRVAIRHSNRVEWFDLKALEVDRLSVHARTGRRLWMLK